MKDKPNCIKRILLNILDYLKYQVENDKCTMEEMRSIQSAIVNNLDIDASVMDVAQHYNQKESNVRNVLTRGYIGKPKRKVYYNFAKILKIVPSNWYKSKMQNAE